MMGPRFVNRTLWLFMHLGCEMHLCMDEAERGLVYSVIEEWRRTSGSRGGPTHCMYPDVCRAMKCSTLVLLERKGMSRIVFFSVDERKCHATF